MKSCKTKKKAEEYRKNGYSLKEISEKLKISKSTASIWLSNVKISLSGEMRLRKICDDARKKSITVRARKKEKYLKGISKKCSVLNNNKKYSVDDYKIFLALLFWAEGSKTGRRLVFVNSDPDMIKSYLFLLRKAYSIDDSKLRAVLHLHNYHNEKAEIEYWSKVVGVEKKYIIVYRKENIGKRKKDGYRGCISIRYGDVRILDELFLIIDRFVGGFSGIIV